MIKLDLVDERYGHFKCQSGMFKNKTMKDLKKILNQMEAVMILCTGEHIVSYFRARAVRQEAEDEVRIRLKLLNQ